MRSRPAPRSTALTMATLVVGLSAALHSPPSGGEEPTVSRRFSPEYGRLVGEKSKVDEATVLDRQIRKLQPTPGEHPLQPCLRWAKSALADIGRIKDYSCTVVKSERVGKTLIGPQSMIVKVRHEPFSVYLRFLEPAKLRGREVIYVDGQNHDELLVHVTGMRHRLLGTVALQPTSALAMRDNRYPITDLGIRRLVERLIEIGQTDLKDANCEVRASRSSLDGQPCMCIEVEHPRRQAGLLFHVARIYVDERNLPLRYEALDWPTAADEAPALLEQYTYRDLKLNREFSDRDFDVENPDYAFSRGASSKTAMAR